VVTPYSAARLKDFAAILGEHPLTEAMHAQTAADFGLVSTLSRHLCAVTFWALPMKIIV
jgi:hypothetical protein